MNTFLKKEDLFKIVQSEALEALSIDTLTSWFRKEAGLKDFAPDGACQVDPRDGSMVIYNASRAKRPHDNRTEQAPVLPKKPCPICDGTTTGVIDVTPLSDGHTFINKNLFPCVYPFETDRSTSPHTPSGKGGGLARGFHFLQWTSSVHHLDWHNMPIDDLVTVVDRLAALEQHLLTASGPQMPATAAFQQGEKLVHGFVSIIKNMGAPVGGSLTHGHQQIVFSNVMPTQTFNNWRFLQDRGETFSGYLQRENPADLEIADLDTAVVLTPYFMKRPYYSILAIKDTSKQYLHELNAKERLAVARGWSVLAAAFVDMLPRMGREAAYNVVVHNGPGAGLYLEFLPFTQETGGLEQLGLWVCQGEPCVAAVTIKKYF